MANTFDTIKIVEKDGTENILKSGPSVTRTEDTYFGSDWGTNNDRQFAHGTSVKGLNVVSIRITRCKSSSINLVIDGSYVTLPTVNAFGDYQNKYYQNKYLTFEFWTEEPKHFYVNVHRTYSGTEQFNAYWHHVFIEF